MRKKLNKILVTTLILIALPTIAWAIYQDQERSNGNTFVATTLDTVQNNNTYSLTLIPENEVSFTVSYTNIGQLRSSNKHSSMNFSGDQILKDSNNLRVEQDGVEIYPSNTLDNYTDIDLGTLNTGDATTVVMFFYISQVDYDNTPGQSYQIEIQLHSTQTVGHGFEDYETIIVTVTNPETSTFGVSPLSRQALTPSNFIEEYHD